MRSFSIVFLLLLSIMAASSTAFGAGVDKVVLPVSRDFDQLDSDLCWAYAVLNALESFYMTRHPGEEIELSRGFLQHTDWLSGLEDRLSNPRSELNDRGTAMDAIGIIQGFGMSQFKDYSDLSSDYYPDIERILADVARLKTNPQKLRKISSDLDSSYGPLPKTTKLDGRTLSVLDFGRELLGEKPWVSYALVDSKHPAGWGPDPDSDASGKYQVMYTTLDDIKARIRASLKSGVPVVYSDLSHIVMIYGAEFDSSGEATTYYIKDSINKPYRYQADPGDLYQTLGEITLTVQK